ncbi:unnamed protein product [Echinostoma caproni]|uniref:Transcriptional regulator n=1 Tax=Echinostoma caproni TaxID=27848 RepID=A0A183B9F9_9TREM|nr:unnamed protein product [Echinostoma caproni]
MSEERPTVDDRELNLLAISFKPEAFIPHDPEVRYTALETHFAARKVRRTRSKYFHAVEAIPSDRMSAIGDIILKPPEKDAYDVMKAAILQFYSPSNEERIRQLLALHPIGYTTLSRHLARLRSLAGPANAHSGIV